MPKEVRRDSCRFRLRGSPSRAEHAISLLAEHGDDAKLLAGGHSLIPMMRYRLATPSVLVGRGPSRRPALHPALERVGGHRGR